MKQFVILILILSLNSTLFSQINFAKYDFKKFNSGFVFGFNQMSFKIETLNNYQSDSLKELKNKPRNGIEFGGVFSYKISNRLKFYYSPLLGFISTEMNYLTTNDSIKNNRLVADFVVINNIISFKYTSKRFYNHKTSLIFSIVPKYNYKNIAKYLINEQEDETYPYTQYFKQLDLAYEFGFGYIHFGTNNFQSIEIVFSNGINNILIRDASEFTKILKSIKTNNISIRFYIE